MALIFNIVDKHEHLDDNIRVRVVYITYIYSKHVSLVIKSLWKNCIDCVFEVE